MPRTVLCLAAFLVMAVAADGGEQHPSRTTAIDAATYAAELQQLTASIRDADAATIPDLQQRVPPVWTIASEGGTIEVPGIWLQRRLADASRNPQQWPAIRTQLLEGLAVAEREARAHASPPARPGDDAVRASIDEVLARPEFSRIARENAMARLQARVLEWLRRWWARLGGDRLASRSAATVFAWIASLAALSVLAGWLIHTLRASGRRPRTSADAPSSRRIPAHVWARQVIDAEDPREAVRCAWRAVICRFEEDGTWRVDDARTPREYVRLVSAAHTRRDVLQDVARRFEEIWFGGRPATDDDRGALILRMKELGCLPAE